MTDRPLIVRRVLPVNGRQGVEVVVVVTVYRGSVWLAVEPPSESDIAIMVPGQVDRLAETLRWAAHEARRWGMTR